MSEVIDIVLTRVGQTFPAGTVVGLYGGRVSNSGVQRPAGPAIATATVAGDESLTFPAVTVTQPNYYAMALIGPDWRSIQATTHIGEPFTNGVASVNGHTGVVLLGAGDIAGVATTANVSAEAKAREEADAAEAKLRGEADTALTAALAGKQPTLGVGSVVEENLATAVKSKLNAISARPASPFSAYGWMGAAAAAGTRALPPTPAELALGTGTIEVPKAMVFLEKETAYMLQAMFACGVAPSVVFALGVRKLVNYAGGAFTPTAIKTVLTTNNLSSGEAVERRGEQFEVTESGWYQVTVVTVAATAAGSKTGIAISIAP